MITFPDGTKSGIIGLDEVFEELAGQSRQPSEATAEEILNKVENRNYIPSSQRHIYKHLFLEEFRRFLERA
jgi:hypothetical protein